MVSGATVDDSDGGSIRSGSFWTSTTSEGFIADPMIVSSLEVDEVLTVNARWPTKPWMSGRTKACCPASINGETRFRFQKN